MAGEKNIPACWRVCREGLFPLLQEALTVLVGHQKRGIDLIRRRAAGHIVDGFTFRAGGFRHGTHFARDIDFNIQLRQGDRQRDAMSQRRYGFDLFDRRVFQYQLRKRTESHFFTMIVVVSVRNSG